MLSFRFRLLRVFKKVFNKHLIRDDYRRHEDLVTFVTITWELIVKGVRPILEVFVTIHEGACEQEVQAPEVVESKDWTCCSHKPEKFVTTQPDRSALIPIRIRHFNNVVHFACYTHCYVTWCPWRRELSPHNACPSSRDAVLVMRYLTPSISPWLNPVKIILPRWKIFTIYVVMVIRYSNYYLFLWFNKYIE